MHNSMSAGVLTMHELEAQAAAAPSDAALRVEIGLLREREGDAFGACRAYSEALAIEPQYERARRCLELARKHLRCHTPEVGGEHGVCVIPTAHSLRGEASLGDASTTRRPC